MRYFNERRRRAPNRVVLGIACLLVLASTALPAGANPPSIQSKQAQAQQVLAEIDALDSRVNRASEAYDGANLRLEQTREALRANGRLLTLAQVNLRLARKIAAKRLVALYMNGEQPSALEVILGARNLDEMMTRLEAARRVASSDAQLAQQLQAVNSQVRARQQRLRAQQAALVAAVAQRSRQRQLITAELQTRERLLSSIRGQIAKIQADERRRELATAAAARKRLVAHPPPAAPSTPPPTTRGSGTTSPTAPTTEAPAPTPTTATTTAAVDTTTALTTPTTTAPVDTTSESPLPGSRYGTVVAIAMGYLGIPYQWGGASPVTGFDCSGFIMYVYAQIGVSLPHYTGAQYGLGSAVPRDQLQPGDLVFFDGLGHAGIYIGGNEFIHSPHTGDVVKISSISGWYSDTYVGARRL